MSSRRKNNKLVDLLSSPGGFQMTQAFTSPITSRLKGGLFNPLEFNPYLLFDAQTSMLGELEAPTLDLDASDESTLDVITATRAGVATYTDLHGVIKTASADTVRVDWSLGYPAMLIEPSATNLIARSDFSSGWGNGHIYDTSTFKGQPSVKFKRSSSTSTSNYFQWNTPIPNTSGVIYTYQLWLRTLDGSSQSVRILHYSAADANYRTRTVTPEWQLFSVQFTGDGNNIFVGVSALPTGVPFEMAMPQVEEGSVATSYIPTSGSAGVRNADNLVIDGTAFSDFYNQTEGTVYVEYQMADVSGYSHHVFRILGSQTASLISGNGDSRFNNGFAWITGLGTLNNNQLHRTAVSLKASTHKASTDGNAVKTDSSGMLTGASELELGNNLGGHIKRLIYWPTHSDNL